MQRFYGNKTFTKYLVAACELYDDRTMIRQLSVKGSVDSDRFLVITILFQPSIR